MNSGKLRGDELPALEPEGPVAGRRQRRTRHRAGAHQHRRRRHVHGRGRQRRHVLDAVELRDGGHRDCPSHSGRHKDEC